MLLLVRLQFHQELLGAQSALTEGSMAWWALLLIQQHSVEYNLLRFAIGLALIVLIRLDLHVLGNIRFGIGRLGFFNLLSDIEYQGQFHSCTNVLGTLNFDIAFEELCQLQAQVESEPHPFCACSFLLSSNCPELVVIQIILVDTVEQFEELPLLILFNPDPRILDRGLQDNLGVLASNIFCFLHFLSLFLLDIVILYPTWSLSCAASLFAPARLVLRI